jgi:hypothetical protein
VLMLWRAFLFLGLGSFPLFFFLLAGLRCFFLKERAMECDLKVWSMECIAMLKY